MSQNCIWVFRYKKDPKQIYASTMNKNLALSFKIQRNMDLYICDKFAEKEYDNFNDISSVIHSICHDTILFDNVLSDGEHDITFATTFKENEKLDHQLTMFSLIFGQASIKISELQLQDNVKKVFDEILDYYDKDTHILKFDIFHYFIYLFKDYIL